MSTQYWSSWTFTKSAWSVNAMAASPSSIARSQLLSIDPRRPSYDHSVCTWRSAGRAIRQGYNPAVGYVVEAVAYLSGAFLIGAGLYLLMRATFPGWWPERLLWPLVRVTPFVARLQGLTALGLGASILVIVFTSIVPAGAGGILVLAALAAYVLSLLLYLFSAWLSRRPAS